MNPSREPIRLFTESPLAQAGQITLTREQAHYLRNVMRRSKGDSVGLFNGRDGEWRAVIVELGKQACHLELIEQIQPQWQNPDVWLLFAPVKKTRTETIVEKAAEIGVREIRPVMTQYTSAARPNSSRLQAILIEAAEQCGTSALPQLHEPEKLHALLDQWPRERRILFCDESGAGAPALARLQAEAKTPAPWAVLIGPEGGFSPEERTRLQAMPQALAVSLGPRILRADTAAIAAMTLWQSVCGDWTGSPVAIK